MKTISFMEMLSNQSVKIPIMQRDYAQGRINPRTNSIRADFIDAIFQSIGSNKKLTLDFVYGYRDTANNLYLLDGQQRLTTLFLVHWYVAALESHLQDIICSDNNPNATVTELFARFSYETRHSSRVFCAELSKFCPNAFEADIAEYIRQEKWFIPIWANDATIRSMLVVLNEIQNAYSLRALNNVWGKLMSQNDAVIAFYLLPMQNFGLSDELYIKMNSRGKELTDFENFKATYAKSLPMEAKNEFENKVDGLWADLFWGLYKEKNGDISQDVDKAFMTFYSYAFSILDSNDYKTWFSWLDALALEASRGFEVFHNNLNDGTDFVENRARLFFVNPSVNLFKKCCSVYNSAGRTNPFSLGEQLMLYAFLIHMVKNTPDFNMRIRQLRNLISNSDDTLRDEYRKSLLSATTFIITNGLTDEITSINGRHFSTTQIDNELSKACIYADTEAIRLLHAIEDNPLLRGCTSCLCFQDVQEFKTVASAFTYLFAEKGDRLLVAKALLSVGDYSQKQWLNYRFGTKKDSDWRELLTPSTSRALFIEHLQPVLVELLKKLNPDTPITEQLTSIATGYLSQCESQGAFSWRYYFVKYEGFRKSESGCYRWGDIQSKPYESTMLNRTQLNGYHWDPYLYTISTKTPKSTLEVSMDYGNEPLHIPNGTKVENKNSGFVFTGSTLQLITLSESGVLKQSGNSFTLQILQANGIDSEDRIKKCIDVIRRLTDEKSVSAAT
jgi:hypothetical protein